MTESVVFLVHVNLVLSLLHGDQVVLLLQDFDLIRWGSNPGQHHWQEEQAIEDAEDNDEQVHSEVVEFEKRRGGEGKDRDAEELGGGDANDH